MSTVEDELRAAFHQGTADLPHTSDPWTRTTRGIARHRARRRGVVAVLTVVALLGVGATVAPWDMPPPQPAEQDRRGMGPVVTDQEFSRWPTRGDLSDDAAFLDHVREFASTRGEVLGIPYAGTLDDHGLVLVLVREHGTNGPDAGTTLAFRGHPRAPLEKWIQSGEVEHMYDGLAMVYSDHHEPGPVLVLTRSRGVTVSFSASPIFLRSGAVERSYLPLEMANGVGVVRTVPPAGAALAVRADETEPVHTELSGASASDSSDRERWKAVAAAPSCAGVVTEEELFEEVRGVASVVLEQLGNAVVTPVWCRPMQGGAKVMLAVETPAGPSFQYSGIVNRDGNALGVGGGGTVPVPWGRARDYPAAYVDSEPDETRDDNARVPVVVSAPGRASVDLVAGGGVVLGTVRLDGDGYALWSMPRQHLARFWGDDTMIVVKDVAGKVVERVPANRPERRDPTGLRTGGQGS
jgi:hypothetical protein